MTDEAMIQLRGFPFTNFNQKKKFLISFSFFLKIVLTEKKINPSESFMEK